MFSYQGIQTTFHLINSNHMEINRKKEKKYDLFISKAQVKPETHKIQSGMINILEGTFDFAEIIL